MFFLFQYSAASCRFPSEGGGVSLFVRPCYCPQWRHADTCQEAAVDTCPAEASCMETSEIIRSSRRPFPGLRDKSHHADKIDKWSLLPLSEDGHQARDRKKGDKLANPGHRNTQRTSAGILPGGMAINRWSLCSLDCVGRRIS